MKLSVVITSIEKIYTERLFTDTELFFYSTKGYYVKKYGVVKKK
ncbi:hypothetical protein [Pedobacter sp. Hv1]|nr:hypothetical protein [Pedobacter sp. Hv1]